MVKRAHATEKLAGTNPPLDAERVSIVCRKNAGTGLGLGTPATYRILVQGFLHEGYADRLGGLTIIPSDPAAEAPVTTLVGRLIDQADLLGVLNTLYGMLRLPILLVECVSIGDNICSTDDQN